MTGLDALQSAQFVTVNGKHMVMLDADNYEALIEWLETLEDAAIARQALADLKAAGGGRQKAGWLCWHEAECSLAFWDNLLDDEDWNDA